MPPLDHRNRPALAESRSPVGGGWRPGNREPWEFLFGGGDWRHVEVRAWWDDTDGKPVVQVEWRAEFSTWTGEFVVNRDMMRRG